jgi:hypothetical protein
METVAIALVFAAIGCLSVILWRHKVKWHSDLLISDKGKEKLNKTDMKLGIIGLSFLAFAFICFLFAVFF